MDQFVRNNIEKEDIIKQATKILDFVQLNQKDNNF